MSQGFYGFPRILDIVRATTFKAIGKAGATNGAALAGGTASGAPTAPAGPFDVGDVIVDATGKLWICSTAGTDQSSPGSFTQVGGTTSPLTTKGDVWVYGSADSRLGVGSNNQVLTADSTQSLGLKWAAAATGSLSTASAQLSSNVSLNQNSYTDVLSISCAAGTWLVWAALTCGSTTAVQFEAKIWDGTTVYASLDTVQAFNGGEPTVLSLVSIPIVLSGTTTIKVSATSTNSGQIIRAAGLSNSAGNNASTLVGLKVA